MNASSDIAMPIADQWTEDAIIERTFHDYQIYGISFRCEIPLTFPEQPSYGRPDISLHLASENWFSQFIARIPAEPDVWFQHVALPDGSDYVRWRGSFEFLVSSDGRSIACRRLDQTSLESFQTYLLGAVLSFALVKQGYEPLHSTVVIVDGRAVAFLGDSGAGKSSLAAAFVHAGYPVLTDDLLLIREIEGRHVGFPGPSRLKLYPEMAQRFLPGRVGARMNQADTKLIFSLAPRQTGATPVPVHCFYSLGIATDGVRDVSMTTLNGRESVIELIRSTFNRRLVSPQRLQQQFAAAQRLIPHIPVKRITYPRELDIFDRVIQAVVADVRSARFETE